MSFVRIGNTPRDYSWGGSVNISDFVGEVFEGKSAELWVGTHPSSSAFYVESGVSISSDVSLPFMVKLLDAAQPLSIQVHPNKFQAVVGFDLENKLGVSLDAFNRNYKDDNHKPEMIIALQNGFKALCGFRNVDKIVTCIGSYMLVASGDDFETLAEFKDIVLHSNNVYDSVLKKLLGSNFGLRVAEVLTRLSGSVKTFDGELLSFIASNYPNDVGLSVAVLMNMVVLNEGECIYLPAGNVHAYLYGFGLEVMSNSDNVIRAGLTGKHIDVDELLRISDASVLENPLYLPSASGGVKTYHPNEDYTVYDVRDDSVVLSGQAAVAVVLEDSLVSLTDSNGSTVEVVVHGGEFFLLSDEYNVRVEGRVVFVDNPISKV